MVEPFAVWDFFPIPSSGPQVVHQRLWYVFSSLWETEDKRSIAAYRKSGPMWQQQVSSKEICYNDHMPHIQYLMI